MARSADQILKEIEARKAFEAQVNFEQMFTAPEDALDVTKVRRNQILPKTRAALDVIAEQRLGRPKTTYKQHRIDTMENIVSDNFHATPEEHANMFLEQKRSQWSFDIG